ncbi:MAG TPA: C-GCAxxG-C-C family protein [Anaerolineae bacterium]|nr:C-GCAxxG-C-C family protein [Anaerolineae bacterium]HOQ98264.1 C-GCAxxG-C-C family protein [Anaerolineae bacterium]HPL28972.1 C-GCAxxG-C-C family protein [Anaerolineae bacterium]
MPNLRSLSASERRALVQEAAELAAEHFGDHGYNCAESALYGVATALRLPLDDAVLKAATPFGGGIGRAGCVCGALSGSVMALGLALGRTTPDAAQKDLAYERAQRLWQRFVERAGAEDCRELNTLGFDLPDHKALCTRFVAIAAELAAEELLGGGD